MVGKTCKLLKMGAELPLLTIFRPQWSKRQTVAPLMLVGSDKTPYVFSFITRYNKSMACEKIRAFLCVERGQHSVKAT